MAKFFAQLFFAVLAVLLQIGVMTYGWGLTPVSWPWIVVYGFFGHVLIMTFALVTEKLG